MESISKIRGELSAIGIQQHPSQQLLAESIGKVWIANVNNDILLRILNEANIKVLLIKPVPQARGYEVKTVALKLRERLYIETGIGKLEPKEPDSDLETYLKNNFSKTNIEVDGWATFKRN